MLHPQPIAEINQIIDWLPVMLAQHGHAYSARIARKIASVGYCAAKKTYTKLREKIRKTISCWLLAESY